MRQLLLIVIIYNCMKFPVSSKPSGGHIVAPILCFYSERLQNLATCIFFQLESFSMIRHQTFYNCNIFEFLVD
jgi:hypothetical protein